MRERVFRAWGRADWGGGWDIAPYEGSRSGSRIAVDICGIYSDRTLESISSSVGEFWF
jgi:hypothetical protein